MSTQSEWDLIFEGRFEEACRRADQIFVETKRDFPLRNKITALLLLGKYTEAIATCDSIIKNTNGRSEDDFVMSGVASWLSGNREASVKSWMEAQSVPRYTDAAGGLVVPLLLYYASTRMNDSSLEKAARRKIMSRIKDRRAINWPGPLGFYVAGQIDELELFSRVTKQPVLRERQLCTAHFWTACLLMNTDHHQAMLHMREATKFVPFAYVEYEYFLAKAETLRDGGVSAK